MIRETDGFLCENVKSSPYQEWQAKVHNDYGKGG